MWIRTWPMAAGIGAGLPVHEPVGNLVVDISTPALIKSAAFPTVDGLYLSTVTLSAGVPYYWRVAIVDRDGKVGPFSDAVIIIDPNEADEILLLPMIMR